MINTILGPLFKMVGYDYKNKRAKDKELLAKFLEVLPSGGDSIVMLKEHDMGDPVEYEFFRPLNEVEACWNAPDKEFQVKKLQKLKSEFVGSLSTFLSEYAKRSGTDGYGFISIGIRDMEDRQDMLKYKDLLNQLASEAYKNYEAFILTARREI